MADTQATDLPVLTALASADVLYVVDASDTTDDPEGSSKQITAANLATGLTSIGGLATDAEVTTAVSTHAAVTSGVHGISAFGATLVDDADAAAARTTLELGGSATLAVGTTAGTVAAGNDSRLSDARTPTAHASSHADGGSDEIAVDASQITSGTLATARLGSGTADGTTFLRGDQTWATPAGGGDVATDAIWDAKGDLVGGTGADAAARLAVGSNGSQLVADSTTSTGLAWAPSLRSIMQTTSTGGTGRYSLPGTINVMLTGVATPTIAADRLYVSSWLIPSPITITAIAAEVTTGAAGTECRVGLYEADAEWMPTTLVADWGTIPTTSSSSQAITGLSTALAGGRYIIAWIFNGTPVLRGRTGSLTAGIEFRGAGTLSSNHFGSGNYFSQAYGALPSTAPTTLVAGSAVFSVNYNCPWLALWS